MTVLTLPIYKVTPENGKFYIKKENGTFVGGNWVWEEEEEAKAYLNRLIAMKYCKGE